LEFFTAPDTNNAVYGLPYDPASAIYAPEVLAGYYPEAANYIGIIDPGYHLL